MTRVAEIFREAGLPAGVFNVVHGTVESEFLVLLIP
jgi:acyl-CoA reductase-like NAD-dependent aldehyde dehydrogenase